MHFGQFLLQQGAVTPRQVLEALDEQRHATPFIGKLAVGEGVMTVDQVLAVLDELNCCGPTGVHFGDIAMQKGFIDEATRDRLLELQKGSYDPLGEVLVRKGVLTEKRMAGLLKEFIHVARIGKRMPRTTRGPALP